MWIALAVGGCGGDGGAQPSVDLLLTPPQAAVAPAGFTVGAKPELVVGEGIELCVRRAPIFSPGVYTCGKASVAVVDGPIGPDILDKDLWEAAQKAGMGTDSEIIVMEYAEGAEPHNAMASGGSLGPPFEVRGYLGSAVAATTDGRKVIFLSQP